MPLLTPKESHEAAVQTIREVGEDHPRLTFAEGFAVVSDRLAKRYGLPVDRPTGIGARFTAREVREEVYSVLDKLLPGTVTTVEIMHELDNRLALAAAKKASHR